MGHVQSTQIVPLLLMAIRKLSRSRYCRSRSFRDYARVVQAISLSVKLIGRFTRDHCTYVIVAENHAKVVAILSFKVTMIG